jgi:hypothetical protein
VELHDQCTGGRGFADVEKAVGKSGKCCAAPITPAMFNVLETRLLRLGGSALRPSRGAPPARFGERGVPFVLSIAALSTVRGTSGSLRCNCLLKLFGYTQVVKPTLRLGLESFVLLAAEVAASVYLWEHVQNVSLLFG